MDEAAILGHLEALAHTLDVQIRYEQLESDTAFPRGGFCRIRERHVIIVDKRATTREKVRTLAVALRRFDLSQVYLRPAVRDFLEGAAEKGVEGSTG